MTVSEDVALVHLDRQKHLIKDSESDSSFQGEAGIRRSEGVGQTGRGDFRERQEGEDGETEKKGRRLAKQQDGNVCQPSQAVQTLKKVMFMVVLLLFAGGGAEITTFSASSVCEFHAN